MIKEYVWGCELNSENKEFVWEMADDLTEEINCSLLLKQAMLATSVRDKQVNVVALESVGMEDAISQPLFRLTAGRVDQCQLDIVINHPGSKISLVEGSGPVYLWGQQVFEYVDEDGSNKDDSAVIEEAEEEAEYEEEEDEDEEELKKELDFLNGDNAKLDAVEKEVLPAERSKKRPAPSGQERARKRVA